MAFAGLLRRPSRRLAVVILIALSVSYFFFYSPSLPSRPTSWRPRPPIPPPAPAPPPETAPASGGSKDGGDSSSKTKSKNKSKSAQSYDWASRKERYPVPKDTMVGLPTDAPRKLPRVQHDFSQDEPDAQHEKQQATRRDAVKKAFVKNWKSYRKHAWGADELRPLSLDSADTFGGWGATLVDSLDTLWIMDLKDDFKDAVLKATTIDWSSSTGRECSLFETTIRYLGGLLSAYDLSGDHSLVDQALELGHMLYAAFDNPNRMPVNGFNFEKAKEGTLSLSAREFSTTVGSFSLEFTRLAQLTGEVKFYDAVDRVKRELSRTQDMSELPGMWPMFIDVLSGFGVHGSSFTLSSMADSLYEYLPKMYALLGGVDETYGKMHKYAAETARKHILYRPMIPDHAEDVLVSGSAQSNGAGGSVLYAENQHLGCFTGGMYALGGRLLDMPDHVAIGARLARGCAWAYGAFPHGIMPEVSEMVACRKPDLAPCEWNQTVWDEASRSQSKTLPLGFSAINDRRYILRPEAIESVFVLYRITGDREWLEFAWTMFQAIQASTDSEHANSAIADVMASGRKNMMNSMESFWLAETLKYFYLIFSEPSLISLDEYVFNTEAHPLKIARPA